MKKWHVCFDINGGEYTGWVTFFAKEVEMKTNKILIVDGNEMEFDEGICYFTETE